MRTIIPLFLLFYLVAWTQGHAEENTTNSQIRQWVQQLGDDSFIVRQRAEKHLIRAGMDAYPELHRAKKKPDIEVARRAEYLLSQIEQVLLDKRDQDVVDCLLRYITASDLSFKARCLWYLADPAPTPGFETGFERGEGLATLCRLVRFEEESAMRLEAAKCLIASPPLLPTQRQKWYRYIRENIQEVDGDELLQCVRRYAILWCDLDEAEAENKATSAFQDRVREVGGKVLRLLEKSNGGILPGSKIDLLLHYAVTDLQDHVGLTEDRDKTIAAALTLTVAVIETSKPIDSIGIDDNRQGFEHWYVGSYLKERYRLHWALAHFQKVVEEGDIELRDKASEMAAVVAIFLSDYTSATAFIDKHIEILESPNYKKRYSDSNEKILIAQKRKAYCFAEAATAKGNWQEIQNTLMQVWTMPSPASDFTYIDTALVIVAHRLCKQQPNVDREFKRKMDSIHKKLWQHFVQNCELMLAESQLDNLSSIYNEAAWLLANTDGDYSSALTLIEAALKAVPDNIFFLNTLAHVYFLGGKREDAIRIQEQVVRDAPEAAVFRQALERFRQ